MKTWLQRILYTFCTACRPHRSRTVRYAFPILLLSLAFLGAATITSNNTSYVSLKPSTSLVTEGQQFYIDVRVFAHAPVNAIDLAVAFPASQVEVKNIDAGQSVITLWTQEPSIKNNTVYLQGGTYRKGFAGDHFIARIDAVAKKSGVAKIEARNIRLLAGDGAGSEVSLADENENVNVRIANQNGEIVGEIQVIKVVTDIDGDGEVDLKDISIFMAAWRNRDVIFDFSGDGKMTFRDFAIILADSFFK